MHLNWGLDQGHPTERQPEGRTDDLSPVPRRNQTNNPPFLDLPAGDLTAVLHPLPNNVILQ